ncbi:hypothetical protein J2X16_004846 [Pelomonas aquatica]|uniref:Uncharacterized protein n=1 Tax=Pelomonas aquatica TaxID=431058 RepID=A0ABU1ZHE1_9BURK|nr:hypothetical protein [Pelomonas aquatica]
MTGPASSGSDDQGPPSELRQWKFCVIVVSGFVGYLSRS